MVKVREFRFYVVLLIAGSMLLSACGAQPAQPTPIATTAPTSAAQATSEPLGEPTSQPTVAVSPTSAAVETVTSGPTEAPDALARELEAKVGAQLPATPTPDASGPGFGGFSGVKAFKLQDGDAPLYAVYSTGARSFDPETDHFLAVYERKGTEWTEVARTALKETDIMPEGAGRRVEISSDSAWIEVAGGAGAHSGTYYIYKFENGKLEEVVNHSNSGPGAGDLMDLDGDGKPEVVLNAFDYYVFCYACSVYYINYEVKRWDGAQMVDVRLENLGPDAPQGAQDATQKALKLAEGDLWKDALVAAEEALRLAPEYETTKWNAALIKLTAEARRAHVGDTGYPLLANIFYGDYDAAVASIREFSPEEIFHPQTPLIKDTPAESSVENLTEWMEKVTSAAIKADPNKAGAHFFHGWALWRAKPESPEAVASFKRAAELAPNEELFGFVVGYVTNK